MKKNYKWNDEQLAYLVVARMKGDKWEQISEDMFLRFGMKRSPTNISGKYNKTIGVDLSNAFTAEQEKFIQNCWTNNFQTKQIIMGFKEQFGRTINENHIDMAVKLIQHEDSVEKEISEQKIKIKREMNKMRTLNTWTKEEDDMIMSCKSRKEALALNLNGRTKGAKRNRWQLLKPTRKPLVKPVANIKKPAKRGRMTTAELEMIRNCETVEEALALNLRKPETIIQHFTTFNSKKKEVVLAVKPKQKNHGNKGKKYTSRWTTDEDYDLILNFYELSIDEARNRFNRSYGAIATRLEMLVDSTKPEHISMLMEASKEIKTRKESQNTTPRKSRRTLRKERKMAKKQAKLEAQLQKLRGD